VSAALHFGDLVRDGETLSATLLLRPTVSHLDLLTVLSEENRRAIHLKLIRDDDVKPVDALHVHGHAPAELSRQVEEAIWRGLALGDVLMVGDCELVVEAAE